MLTDKCKRSPPEDLAKEHYRKKKQKVQRTKTIACLALWRKSKQASILNRIQERLLGSEDREVREAVGTLKFVGHFKGFVLLSIFSENPRRFEQRGATT